MSNKSNYWSGENPVIYLVSCKILEYKIVTINEDPNTEFDSVK